MNKDACTACDGSNHYELIDGSCRLQAGYGYLNKTLEVVQPCASEGCMNCTNNYQICTECDTSRGYILAKLICRHRKNHKRMKLISASFALHTQKARVTFERDLDLSQF